jgi:peptide/nickel transport system substrate-binding protein
MKKRWLAALLLTLGALIFATSAIGSGKKSASGGVFKVGTASGIDSLNPYVAFNQDAYSTFEYIYPVLVQLDSHLHYAPFFARSWK